MSNMTLVSIHAPAGGATKRYAILIEEAQFQSTLPQGERLIQTVTDGGWWQVSIHAPAGGATPYVVVGGWLHLVSIHAPAGGATHAKGCWGMR